MISRHKFYVNCFFLFLWYNFYVTIKEELALNNNISVTVRLPHELNLQLTSISKEMGVSKTSFIRTAVRDFLTTDPALDFSVNSSDNRDRLVLNLNPITYEILKYACNKYNQSANAVIVAVTAFALECSAKWLQSVKK